jgi:hypothetical protein
MFKKSSIYPIFFKFPAIGPRNWPKIKRKTGMDGGQIFPTGDLLNPAMITLSQHMLTATLNNKVLQHECSSIPSHKKEEVTQQ